MDGSAFSVMIWKIKFDGMENKGHNGISTDCEERIECGYWL